MVSTVSYTHLSWELEQRSSELRVLHVSLDVDVYKRQADIRAYVHTLLNSEYSIIEAADGTEGIRKAVSYTHLADEPHRA